MFWLVNLRKMVQLEIAVSQQIFIFELVNFIILQITNMLKEDHAQIYEMLSVLFLTLSKGEQAQQCIRQVFTSQPLFSPFPLFKYLSHNTTTIKSQHLLQFLEENKEHATQEQIRSIIQFEPGKKAWQYSDFLEFIYPYNSAVLRQISNMHLKRYPKLEKYGVPESALAGFLILLTQQISLIRKLQTQKSDSLLKIPKDRLRKVLLTIKKAGQKQPSHCQNDQTRVTSLQLRNFMKAFVSVEDSHFLYLSRRLGIKQGSFPIEQLEKFIKPSKKAAANKPIKVKQNIKIEHYQRQFDQREYKDQLLSQLTNTFNAKDRHQKRPYNAKNQTQDFLQKHNGQLNSFYYEQQNANNYNQISQNNDGSLTNRQRQTATFTLQNDNYFVNQPKPELSTISPKELLIRFIQTFLPTNRRLQELKTKLAQHRLDYFKLFKIIDKTGRGVAGAQDLLHYYTWAGGRQNYSVNDFQLLIQKYSQSDEPWITLTEFCEMVRGEEKEVSRALPKLSEEHQQLVVKIIEVTLQNQKDILQIRKQFRKHQSKYLFNLINREQTGFINYQELKKFLSEAGLNLSMHDLMAVLKRLDRSRNGVVVQHEFVSYFQPPGGF